MNETILMCNIIHNFILKFNNKHTNEKKERMCHFPPSEDDEFIGEKDKKK